MTSDLFHSTAARADVLGRSISPRRELGAYEALWAKEGTWFKSIADGFRAHEDAVPSDFASEAEIEKYARLALGAIRAAGIKHFGVRVHGAGEYPQKLRDADHPIELLYFQGLWDLVNTRCVAVVGAREASEAGLHRAALLAKYLVADAFTVVSGLARGVDTAVHTAAMEAGGYTIAVLGTPITEYYPAENRELQQRIADHHLVISQVPIVRYANQHFQGKKHFFPERNVTMSALTEATVIVEASDTSGTLVQARHALKQGRKLFIMDNCFKRPSLKWPAKFAELGAIRVGDYGDIRKHLAPTDPDEAITDR
jgi:DNA processing protein